MSILKQHPVLDCDTIGVTLRVADTSLADYNKPHRRLLPPKRQPSGVIKRSSRAIIY
jgi:hypothetical protein